MNNPYVEGITAALELKASHAELLEALQKVRDFKVTYRKGATTDELLDAISAQFDALQETAKAAIAKAETSYPRG